MTTTRLACCLCLPLSFLACGGSGSGGAASTPPGASGNATEFCNSFAQAATRVQVECYGGGQAFWSDLYARALDCPELARLAASGILRYDANQARQCLAAISAVACNDMGTLPACEATLTGTIAPGGACRGDARLAFDDCASGSRCVGDSNSCGGTCVTLAALGKPCGFLEGDHYVDCEEGATCDYQTDLCVVEATLGHSCRGPGGVDCADGFYCDGDYSVAGLCRDRKTSGSCLDSAECANGFVCGETGTCERAKLPGESCRPGECVSLFAHCGADGKCTTAGVTEGQACGFLGDDYLACASGLYCAYSATTSGTCKRQLAAGASCTSNAECAGNGYCDATTGSCVSCS